MISTSTTSFPTLILVFVAVLLVASRLIRSGRVAVRDQRIGRFAQDVDARAAKVIHYGRRSHRNLLLVLAAVCLALFVPRFRAMTSYVLVAGLAVLVARHWSAGAGPNVGDEPARQPPIDERRPPESANARAGQPARRPVHASARQVLPPIRPLPRAVGTAPTHAAPDAGFFSLILPAFGILCLILGGGFALLVASGELHSRAPRIYAAPRTDAAFDKLIHDRVADVVDRHVSVFADGVEVASKVVAAVSDPLGLADTEHEGAEAVPAKLGPAMKIFEPDDSLDYLAGEPRIAFLSSLHSSESEAFHEALERLGDYIRLAVAADARGAAGVDWRPDPEWVERTFVVGRSFVPNASKEPGIVQARVEANLDPDSLSAADALYHRARASERVGRLAKVYAGTVLILGGLAMVLRIGTGARPGKGVGAGIFRGGTDKPAHAQPATT